MNDCDDHLFATFIWDGHTDYHTYLVHRKEIWQTYESFAILRNLFRWKNGHFVTHNSFLFNWLSFISIYFIIQILLSMISELGLCFQFRILFHFSPSQNENRNQFLVAIQDLSNRRKVMNVPFQFRFSIIEWRKTTVEFVSVWP